MEALLAQAKDAAEGRERWRKAGPIFAQLIELGVPYAEIETKTGVAPATFARMAARARQSGHSST